MAIRGTANRILFNEFNHLDTNPTVQFQSLDENSHFSFSFWLKPVEATDYDAMFAYNGTNGAQIIIGQANQKWFIQFNGAGGLLQSFGQFDTALVGRWAVICFSFEGRHMMAYIGNETIPPVSTTPVTLLQVGEGDVDINLSIPFSFLHVASSHNTATCNLKYWNRVLTMAEFETQVNQWTAGDAMWASTLRTPGDISSIANPRTSPRWYDTHGYELEGRTIRDELEIYEPDPAYLATQPCPTWVYPIIDSESPLFVTFSPGSTPVNTTTYKAPQFWQFEDRGSVPIFPSPPAITVEYYAYPFLTGSGPAPSDSWPLYKNENDVELVTDFGNPANRFEQDTGVTVPNSITATNIYHWKFGGQFTWHPSVITSPVSTGNLGYPRLLVVYTGIPTGSISIPAEALTGLFALDKTRRVDRYNQGVEVKIPNPTIKTAFIGE